MYDASELASKARHAAAGPVGTEALTDIGQQIDNAWVITTNHGQHERRRHALCPLQRIIQNNSRFNCASLATASAQRAQGIAQTPFCARSCFPRVHIPTRTADATPLRLEGQSWLWRHCVLG